MTSLSEEALRDLYLTSSTIAVVGCSDGWPKPAAVVPAYMQSEGYRILPVNPNEDRVLGIRCVDTLAELDEPIDIVDVFRPAAEAPAIAIAAVEIGARCLWLQSGIVSEEARRTAEEAGLLYVEDRCIGISQGELGLGPGVAAWKAEQEKMGRTA